MSYVQEKIIKGKKYLYLVKTVRVAGTWKKFSVYLGKGNLGKERLHKLKGKYSKILDQKISAYLQSVDPLFSLLSKKQTDELEKVREAWKKFRGRTSVEAERSWYEWFLTTFTYNTNAIEGSTITQLETSMILFDELTPPGKTMREIREVENHKKAFDYVTAYRGSVSKNFICRTHGILSSGILKPTESGAFRKVRVFIRGAEVIPPKPEDAEKQFKELMLWYRGNKRRYHPGIVAAYMHAAFEGIHPFVDFNGRTGRLLLNFILMRNGLPPIAIAYRRRREYYKAIQAAIGGNLKPIVQLIYRYLRETKLE